MVVEEEAVNGLARDEREEVREKEGNLNLNLDKDRAEVEENEEKLKVADELVIFFY